LSVFTPLGGASTCIWRAPSGLGKLVIILTVVVHNYPKANQLVAKLCSVVDLWLTNTKMKKQFSKALKLN